MAISDTQVQSGLLTTYGPFQLWGGRYSFSATVTAVAWQLQRLGADGSSWIELAGAGSATTTVVELPPGTYQFTPTGTESSPGATLELVRF